MEYLRYISTRLSPPLAGQEASIRQLTQTDVFGCQLSRIYPQHQGTMRLNRGFVSTKVGKIDEQMSGHSNEPNLG
jgi:hypothetical protein